MLIIKGGQIHDAVREQAYSADIAAEGGIIRQIAKDIPAGAGDTVIDAAGMQVFPGLVDAHSHLGVVDHGMRLEGDDLNEFGKSVTPHLRGSDSFYPHDVAVRQAREGGVTTVCTGPGSANVLGGTFAVIKTFGNCTDDMIVKDSVAMKCALGENPKFTYSWKECGTRMGVAAVLREALLSAEDYLRRKEAAGDDILKAPKFDMKMEALIPVLRREIPIKVHAHRADDICTAIRIAKEFDLKLTIEHCTEGHLIVEELVRAGWPVAIGPLVWHSHKAETSKKSMETPGILAKAGLQVSIITDHPEVPQEQLALSAGLAVKAGMEPFAALQAITINPARHIGVADRVGSIEVGKDADFVLADGDILLSSTKVKKVIVNGVLAVEAE